MIPKHYRWFWSLVRPFVRRWLAERALVLPASERIKIANALKTDVYLVESLEQSLRERVLEAFDTL